MKKTNDIDHFLESLIDRILLMPDTTIDNTISERFSRIVTSIRRSKKEFNSNLFLILAFGPVKSGKSTLINLLARQNEVSPTKFGVECTLRPSIIIRAKHKPCIKRYISKGSNLDIIREKENFHKVLDHIRGIAEESELFDTVHIEEFEFSTEKIQQLVAGGVKDYSEVSKEPLITVIEVGAEHSKLIDEHTAIVDVPGLDGVKSNWRESAVHDWILTRSDFLLFVQSSMAALNYETISFLKEVYINSKEPPMQLVQNIIEAKYWRGKEYLMNEAMDQKKEGQDQILKIIPKSKNNEFDTSPVNLGIAHDSLFYESFGGEENVLDTSGYNKLEQKLLDLLELRREEIQFKNSMKSLKQTLNSTTVTFSEICMELDERLKVIHNHKSNFNKISEGTAELLTNADLKTLYRKYNNKSLSDFVEDISNELKNGFEKALKSEFGNYDLNESNWKKTKVVMKKRIEDTYTKFKEHHYSTRSELSTRIVDNLNHVIYNAIKDQLFSEDVNISKILNEVKVSHAILPEDYLKMTDKKNIGVIYADINLEEVGLKKEESKTGFMGVLKELKPDETKKKNMASVNELMRKHIDGEFYQGVSNFLENELHQAMSKVLGDIKKIRIPFEEKLSKSTEECNNVRKTIETLRPEIEEKVQYLSSAI